MWQFEDDLCIIFFFPIWKAYRMFHATITRTGHVFGKAIKALLEPPIWSMHQQNLEALKACSIEFLAKLNFIYFRIKFSSWSWTSWCCELSWSIQFLNLLLYMKPTRPEIKTRILKTKWQLMQSASCCF